MGRVEAVVNRPQLEPKFASSILWKGAEIGLTATPKFDLLRHPSSRRVSKFLDTECEAMRGKDAHKGPERVTSYGKSDSPIRQRAFRIGYGVQCAYRAGNCP